MLYPAMPVPLASMGPMATQPMIGPAATGMKRPGQSAINAATSPPPLQSTRKSSSSGFDHWRASSRVRSRPLMLQMVQMNFLLARHQRGLHWSRAIGITSPQHLRIVASMPTLSFRWAVAPTDSDEPSAGQYGGGFKLVLLESDAGPCGKACSQRPSPKLQRLDDFALPDEPATDQPTISPDRYRYRQFNLVRDLCFIEDVR